MQGSDGEETSGGDCGRKKKNRHAINHDTMVEGEMDLFEEILNASVYDLR